MAGPTWLQGTAPPDIFGAAACSTRPMTLFDHPEFSGHEQVVFSHDGATGLRAIIAIHNTSRGPALGGCRMWPYADETAALEDALRLSRGMTYKAAMAGLDLGGGKAVIIGDAKTDKSEALMKAFGRAVDRLNRRYITAEDVGTTVADMDTIRTVTDHVVGVTGGAGDPSNSTAHGVCIGILAAVRHKLGRDTLDGLHVAVQGVGHVGRFLCDYLHKAGARLSVTDIDRAALERAERDFGAAVVGPDEIFGLDCDLFAPCALGAVVNDATLPGLKCPIVAGSANNVLDAARHRLNRRYITAEDVGTTVADMDTIRTVTDHVVGVTGGAGDPSNSTAHGVCIGILAAVRHKLGRDTLDGLHVAVQGVGHVGRFLCDYLHKAGARLSVTDIDRAALERAERDFGAAVVGPDEIFGLDCDLFAPCALGAVVNDATLPGLKCPIVAGSANNVLDAARHGAALRRAGILYAPDYVINAGGLIDVARFALGFDIETARTKLHRIDGTLTEIFARADAEDRPTADVADAIAEERFIR